MNIHLPPRWERFLWGTALVVFLAGGFLSFFLPVELRRGGSPVRVTLEPGLSSGGIARKLENAGVVRSRWAFRLTALLSGRARQLKAGPYRVWPHESPAGIVDRLARGDMLDTLLTIPEGLTAREIAARVSPVLGCTPDEFLAPVNDAAFAASLGVKAPGLEGYLFPDSYRIVPGSAPRELVRRLVARMLERYGRSAGANPDSLGLSRHEILTLASMVEAEAKLAGERPRIAAVFLNRLRAGMKLQSDPTVAYGLGYRPDRIYESDLQIISPYNTYLVTGLPPGPICSPGESSLRAALHPTPGCRDFYFVATGDGQHLFSETNDAHNEARRRVARDGAPGQGR
jgi:UPF0755 protein